MVTSAADAKNKQPARRFLVRIGEARLASVA
jgi:hypothetical protein